MVGVAHSWFSRRSGKVLEATPRSSRLEGNEKHGARHSLVVTRPHRDDVIAQYAAAHGFGRLQTALIGRGENAIVLPVDGDLAGAVERGAEKLFEDIDELRQKWTEKTPGTGRY